MKVDILLKMAKEAKEAKSKEQGARSEGTVRRQIFISVNWRKSKRSEDPAP